MSFQRDLGFYFGIDSVPLESRRLEVRIPPGIATEEGLFSAFDVELSLPDYFGENWDAFEECIRDLGWVGPKQVVLIHKDLPLLAKEQLLKTYLEILSQAVSHWKVRGDHELVVVFPQEFEGKVSELLSGFRSEGC